jgi:hypothetical protein
VSDLARLSRGRSLLLSDFFWSDRAAGNRDQRNVVGCLAAKTCMKWSLGVSNRPEILLRLFFLVGTILAVSSPFSAPAADKGSPSSDLQFQVQLVWGTNGPKPDDKPFQVVNDKLREQLKVVFKWENYYEVCRKPFSVPKDTSARLKLSDRCQLEMQQAGPSRVEIRLFGGGRLVLKKTQPVVPGEISVLAGDSENDTGWFVVLTPTK